MLTGRQHGKSEELLSIFVPGSYTELVLQETIWKGIKTMAEFGENLKRIREEKGMTQQTLADYLYVTRQAVSRWEGGSRYPDLMTAKKMAQFLDTSVDELLADDDMKAYVEKSAIFESERAKNMQVVVTALAFMCSIVMSLLYLANYFIQDMFVISSWSETVKCMLLTLVLGYATYMAVTDKISQKIATIITGTYFGTAILTGLAGFVWETGFTKGALIGGTALNIGFLVICIRFFYSKVIVSPVAVYVAAGVFAIVGFVSYFAGFMTEIPIEIYRDVFFLHTFALLENLLVLGLICVMAHVLHKKRKLVAR